MFRSLINKISHSVDWVLAGAIFFVALAGILTMSSFGGKSVLAERQVIWLGISTLVMIGASLVDWRFLRRSSSIVALFGLSCLTLLFLFVMGSVFKGAKSWFDFGAFAFQPVDFAKLTIILLLSKYFGRRHVEIANLRHILTSGFYAFILFLLVFLQPDFGSAIIIFFIWLSMVLFSGISKKHLLSVFLLGLAAFCGLWFFVFQDYQRSRIVSFLNPLTDLSGAGYNAYQSMIAVGSGQIVGKGVGLGSQSKLQFLPEYETDFIFAAFSEEWGFVGVTILFVLYAVILGRIISIGKRGETNFEVLYSLGLAAFLLSHLVVNVGMNIGLMPITGITMPFMSYGGSHLLAEFLSIGILMGQGSYARAAHRAESKNEIIGVV